MKVLEKYKNLLEESSYMNKTNIFYFLAFAVLSSVSIGLLSTENSAFAQGEQLVEQKTAVSMQDPLPGHEAHQIVIIAPPRDDGAIWSGRASWTSSVPLEAVILHQYDNSTVTNASQASGPVATAPFGDGHVAISLLKDDSNTPIPSGSMEFAGTAFALHNIEGEPFTVTYTVDAEAKTPIATTSNSTGVANTQS